MELALSLGDRPKALGFLDKSEKMVMNKLDVGGGGGGFCMGLGRGNEGENTDKYNIERRGSSDPPVQLDLLPFSPVPRSSSQTSSHLMTFSWLTQNCNNNNGSGGVKQRPSSSIVEKLGSGGNQYEDVSGTAPALSSPNSTTSSFQMEFSIYRSNKRDLELANEAETERPSDEEDINGIARKKLRLTKEQSAFLEESFKEHNTLNPKQKLALAKQLNLRPRQVEVWFQNRRARTKLKQTEVDCEYLKRCCETLTEENRRLQKELQELRALKSSQPFYMHLPATTLTMCPSCERVATTAAPTTSTTTTSLPKPT